MIAAEVELDVDVRQYMEVVKWCNTYIGNQAIWKDNVNKHNPWTVDAPFRCYTFYFAEEKYATMFKLRWL